MEIRVSGKLMIAGEYAVLRPFGQAVLSPTQRQMVFTFTTLEDTRETIGTIYFRQGEIPSVYEITEDGMIHDNDQDNLLNIGLKLMSDVFKACHMVLEDMAITIESELENDKGISLGLGSSAALCVGLVKGCLKIMEKEALNTLFEHLNMALTDAGFNQVVYRLAMIVHYLFQGNGSGADIAVCAFEETILYEGINSKWLQTRMREKAIDKGVIGRGLCGHAVLEFIGQDWQGGKVMPLTLPSQLCMTGIWTGEKASSKVLVDRFWQAYKQDPSKVNVFYDASHRAIHKLIKSCQDNDLDAFLVSIMDQKKAINALDVSCDIGIHTPVTQSFEQALMEKGLVKLSGAGGGDCFIYFGKTPLEKIIDLKAQRQFVIIDFK